MCLVFPKPRRLMIPSAAEASPQTSPCKLISRSLATEMSPSPSDAALSEAYSSDSPLLSAMRVWVRDHPFLKCFPIIMHPPVVDFRVSLSPAQSASVNTLSLSIVLCHLNLCTSLGLPLRYRASLFNLHQSAAVGLLTPLASSFTSYDMSGRSGDK